MQALEAAIARAAADRLPRLRHAAPGRRSRPAGACARTPPRPTRRSSCSPRWPTRRPRSAPRRRRRPLPHQAVLPAAPAAARRRARARAPRAATPRVRLGVNIGYWGLGLTAGRAARAGAGGRAARLRLRLDRRGLRVRRGDRPRLARRPDGADPARHGDHADAGALRGDDGDDGGHARPAVGRARPARHRLERPAGRRGLARPALRPPARSARATTSTSCAWRCAASGVEYHGETLELPLPDGPGKALKLTIAPGAGADPDLPRRDRPEEHRARRRDRRRLDSRSSSRPSTWRSSGRCSRRASRARAAARRRGLRRRPDRERHRERGPRRGARRDAPVPRALRRRDGLARAELLQPARRGATGSRTPRATVQDLYLAGRKDEAAAALPGELIDAVSLCGPPDVVRDRLARLRATRASAR